MKPDDLTETGEWKSPEHAFRVTEKMNHDMKRDANMRVKPGDSVVCVGDFACRGGEKGVRGAHETPAAILEALNGTWVLVEGNHDDQNSVKTVARFMECEVGPYYVGVQHVPLYDPENPVLKRGRPGDDAPWRVVQAARDSIPKTRHTRYCQETVDFMIVGHVHQAWKVKKIAGLWHINVGVDVNRYMPINDQEVIQIYEKAKKGNMPEVKWAELPLPDQGDDM